MAALPNRLLIRGTLAPVQQNFQPFFEAVCSYARLCTESVSVELDVKITTTSLLALYSHANSGTMGFNIQKDSEGAFSMHVKSDAFLAAVCKKGNLLVQAFKAGKAKFSASSIPNAADACDVTVRYGKQVAAQMRIPVRMVNKEDTFGIIANAKAKTPLEISSVQLWGALDAAQLARGHPGYHGPRRPINSETPMSEAELGWTGSLGWLLTFAKLCGNIRGDLVPAYVPDTTRKLGMLLPQGFTVAQARLGTEVTLRRAPSGDAELEIPVEGNGLQPKAVVAARVDKNMVITGVAIHDRPDDKSPAPVYRGTMCTMNVALANKRRLDVVIKSADGTAVVSGQYDHPEDIHGVASAVLAGWSDAPFLVGVVLADDIKAKAFGSFKNNLLTFWAQTSGVLTPMPQLIQEPIRRVVPVVGSDTPQFAALAASGLCYLIRPGLERCELLLLDPSADPLVIFETKSAGGVSEDLVVLEQDRDAPGGLAQCVLRRYTRTSLRELDEYASALPVQLRFTCLPVPPRELVWTTQVTGILESHWIMRTVADGSMHSIIWVVRLAKSQTEETVAQQPFLLQQAVAAFRSVVTSPTTIIAEGTPADVDALLRKTFEAWEDRLPEDLRKAKAAGIGYVPASFLQAAQAMGDYTPQQKLCSPLEALLLTFLEPEAKGGEGKRQRLDNLVSLVIDKAPMAEKQPGVGVTVMVCQTRQWYTSAISRLATPVAGQQLDVVYGGNVALGFKGLRPDATPWLPDVVPLTDDPVRVLSKAVDTRIKTTQTNELGLPETEIRRFTFKCVGFPKLVTVRLKKTGKFVGVITGEHTSTCEAPNPLLGALSLGDVMCWVRELWQGGGTRDVSQVKHDKTANYSLPDSRPFVAYNDAFTVPFLGSYSKTSGLSIDRSKPEEVAALVKTLHRTPADALFMATT